MFPYGPSLDFSEEDCPMLIGINKTTEYQVIPLMKSDTLLRAKKKFDLGAVWKELIMFRDEFEISVNEWTDFHDQFPFSRKVSISWKMFCPKACLWKSATICH